MAEGWTKDSHCYCCHQTGADRDRFLLSSPVVSVWYNGTYSYVCYFSTKIKPSGCPCSLVSRPQPINLLTAVLLVTPRPQQWNWSCSSWGWYPPSPPSMILELFWWIVLTGETLSTPAQRGRKKPTSWTISQLSFRSIETIIDSVETGIPELGLPPMDPMELEQLDFQFFNLSLEVKNISQTGFKNMKLEKSLVDKDARSFSR